MSDAPPSSEIQINVKGPRALRLRIDIATDKTVLDLKQAIADISAVPTNRQRLIYSGRVLKDEDTLSACKIQSSNTIHMVKGAFRSAAAAASPSVAPQQLPNMHWQADQNPDDPLARSNDHLGYGPMAWFNPFAETDPNPNRPNMDVASIPAAVGAGMPPPAFNPWLPKSPATGSTATATPGAAAFPGSVQQILTVMFSGTGGAATATGGAGAGGAGTGGAGTGGAATGGAGTGTNDTGSNGDGTGGTAIAGSATGGEGIGDPGTGVGGTATATGGACTENNRTDEGAGAGGMKQGALATTFSGTGGAGTATGGAGAGGGGTGGAATGGAATGGAGTGTGGTGTGGAATSGTAVAGAGTGAMGTGIGGVATATGGACGTGTSLTDVGANASGADTTLGAGVEPSDVEGGMPVARVPAETEERFRLQLQQLRAMGFTNVSQNMRALDAVGGNVHLAVMYICSERRAG